MAFPELEASQCGVWVRKQLREGLPNNSHATESPGDPVKMQIQTGEEGSGEEVPGMRAGAAGPKGSCTPHPCEEAHLGVTLWRGASPATGILSQVPASPGLLGYSSGLPSEALDNLQSPFAFLRFHSNSFQQEYYLLKVSKQHLPTG